MGAGAFPFGFEWIEVAGLFGVLGVGALEAWWTHPEPKVHHAKINASHDDQSRCPYCHEGFREGQAEAALFSCGTCRTVHHALCWAGHGGCSVYGCNKVQAWAPPDVPVARLVEQVTSEDSGG